jgi:hypothetical protein
MSLYYMFNKSVMHIPRQNRQAASFSLFSRFLHLHGPCRYRQRYVRSCCDPVLQKFVAGASSRTNDTSTSITTTIIIHTSPE